MTIEEKVKIVEQALRMGANIDIDFHNCESREDAISKVKQLSPVFHEDSGTGAKWIASGPLDNREEEDDQFEITAFY